MADSSDKIPPSNSRLHFLLRCFGSSHKVQSRKAPATARRNGRIPSLIFRFKKSSATVPVDASLPEITVLCHDEASLSPEFKKPPPPQPITSRAPAVGAEIVVDSGYDPVKPSRTWKKAESTQFNSTSAKLPPATRTAALLHSVSLPSRLLNCQKDNLKTSVSHLPAAASPASSERKKPAPKPPSNSQAKKFDPVIVIVAVAIVVLWGRLCAILCTAAMFSFRRRLRSEGEPDGGVDGCGFGEVSSEV